MAIIAGENTDLYVRGIRLHVQTEDWGNTEKSLISRIFKSGAVVKTYKLPYEKIPLATDAQQRRKALIQLHQYVIEQAQKDTI